MSYQSQYELNRLADDLLSSRTFFRDFTGISVLNPGPSTLPQITFTRSTSAGRINQNGVFEMVGIDTPRFDFDPVTLNCRGLLVEEARTNLLVRSEEFDNTSWGKIVGTIISSNASLSPDGNVTSDAIVESNNTINFGVFQSNATTGTMVFSVFAKAANRSWLHLQTDKTATLADIWVNLSTGATGTVSEGVVSVQALLNGWYRVSWTFTATRPNNIAIYAATNNNVQNYAGITNNQSIFIWGAQLEVGSSLTSYIPTTSATVTRAADVLSITGSSYSSMFNPLQGTLVAEGTLTAAIGSRRLATFGGGGLGVGPRTNGSVSSIIWRTPSNFDVATGNVSVGVIKQAFSYANNTLRGVTNGGVIGTNTPTTPLNTTYLNIGASDAGFDQWNGPISRIAFYNKSLSDQLLRTLTLP